MLYMLLCTSYSERAPKQYFTQWEDWVKYFTQWAYTWSHLHAQCALPLTCFFLLLMCFTHTILAMMSRKKVVFLYCSLQWGHLEKYISEISLSSFKNCLVGCFFFFMSSCLEESCNYHWMAQSGKLYSPDAIKFTVFYFLFSAEKMTFKSLLWFCKK